MYNTKVAKLVVLPKDILVASNQILKMLLPLWGEYTHYNLILTLDFIMWPAYINFWVFWNYEEW